MTYTFRMQTGSSNVVNLKDYLDQDGDDIPNNDFKAYLTQICF